MTDEQAERLIRALEFIAAKLPYALLHYDPYTIRCEPNVWHEIRTAEQNGVQAQ